MFKVLITREVGFEGALEPLHAIADVQTASSPVTNLAAAAHGFDGLLTMLDDSVDAGVFRNSLKVVSQLAVGVNNIDLDAATRAGVPVGHTPGVLTAATAELTWTLILAVARRLTEATADLRAGEWGFWDPQGWCGLQMDGSTLGVVGMGQIGQAVAHRAEAFGMNVIWSGPNPKDVKWPRVELPELLERSEVVTLHCPLNDSTRNLIGAPELRRMRRDAILINVSRGGVVDEDALAAALVEGRISGAGSDVFETEPVPVAHPLLRLPNFVALPHIGSATVTTRRRMTELAVANLIAGLRGERLPRCANPGVYS